MSRARDIANKGSAIEAGTITANNIIINGAAIVNQRTSDATASDTFGPDRYRLQFSGGGVTLSQEDLSSSDTPYSYGFRNYVRLKNTSTASGAGDYRQVVYRIEAQDIANSGWEYTNSSSYITISFWVRASVAGKYYFTNETGASGSDQYYAFSKTLVSDTWTKVEHSIPGNSNLSFANTSARGWGFIVRGWLGSNYTDSGFTENSWAGFSLSSLSGDDLANMAGTTNSTLDIVGLQMEVGSKATPFQHLPFGTVLKQCERYYEKTYPYGTAPGTTASYDTIIGLRFNGMNNTGSEQKYLIFRQRTEKRGQPNNTYRDAEGTTGKCTIFNGGGTGTHNNSIGLSLTSTSMVGFGPSNGTQSGISCFIESNAEL